MALTKVRPTSSKVRQAVFNILYDISGMSFLDLFAGTGEVGFEALRRGAKEVVFVEKDKRVCSNLRKKIVSRKDNVELRCMDALSFLKKSNRKFDIIFADPPYNYHSYDKLIKLSLNSLSDSGIFILEHRKERDFNADDRRVYGETAISIWRR